MTNDNSMLINLKGLIDMENDRLAERDREEQNRKLALENEKKLQLERVARAAVEAEEKVAREAEEKRAQLAKEEASRAAALLAAKLDVQNKAAQDKLAAELAHAQKMAEIAASTRSASRKRAMTLGATMAAFVGVLGLGGFLGYQKFETDAQMTRARIAEANARTEEARRPIVVAAAAQPTAPVAVVAAPVTPAAVTTGRTTPRPHRVRPTTTTSTTSEDALSRQLGGLETGSDPINGRHL